MTADQRRIMCDWLVETCLMYGSTLRTAYVAAGLFADGLDRTEAARWIGEPVAAALNTEGE